MSTEELLKPRYKVTADYPDSLFKVGDILQQDFENANDWVIPEKGLLTPCLQTNPANYPNIFRPIEWWEDRAVDDMPEYVKSVDGEEVFKFIQILDRLTPATESDYLTYLNQMSKEIKTAFVPKTVNQISRPFIYGEYQTLLTAYTEQQAELAQAMELLREAEDFIFATHEETGGEASYKLAYLIESFLKAK